MNPYLDRTGQFRWRSLDPKWTPILLFSASVLGAAGVSKFITGRWFLSWDNVDGGLTRIVVMSLILAFLGTKYFFDLKRFKKQKRESKMGKDDI